MDRDDITGQSLYQLVHVEDTQTLEKSHRALLEKGQAVSRYYRLMKKGGGFIWIQSHFNLISNSRNTSKAQHVVGICFILADDPYNHSSILHQPSEQSLDHFNTKMIEPKVSSGVNTSCSSQSSSFETKITTPRLKREKHSHHSMKRNNKIRIHETSTQPITFNPNRDSQLYVTTTSNIPLNSDSQQSHHQCSCFLTINGQNQSITSMSVPIRRPSDDSCSVVSSVASTSLSSASLSYPSSDFSAYAPSENYNSNQHQFAQNCNETQNDLLITCKLNSMDNHQANLEQVEEYQQQSDGSFMMIQRIKPSEEPKQNSWIGNDINIKSVDGLTRLSYNEQLEYDREQTACDTSYFQSSLNWLNQNDCANRSMSSLASPHSQSNGGYYHCIDERSIRYNDSSMNNSQYLASSTYASNNAMIHYQQVPLNNGYNI